MGRLDGKVTIITGTGSGMGRAAAIAFAKEGAKVVGCDIDASRAEAVVAEVTALGGQMVSVQPVDLCSQEDAKRVADYAVEQYGGIDILYNNAAMAHFEFFPKMTVETFNRTIREEVEIIFHLTREVWPHLIARGGGSIINTGSTSAKFGSATIGALAHSTAKAGVVMMSRQLAVEGAPHNIRVNSLSPGLVRSAQTEAFIDDSGIAAKMTERSLIKRPGEPEEIAACALFLASDESSFVTGADLAVDGGRTAW